MSDDAVVCAECEGPVRGTQGVPAEAIGVCRQCWPDIDADEKQQILDHIEQLDLPEDAA